MISKDRMKDAELLLALRELRADESLLLSCGPWRRAIKPPKRVKANGSGKVNFCFIRSTMAGICWYSPGQVQLVVDNSFKKFSAAGR